MSDKVINVTLPAFAKRLIAHADEIDNAKMEE